LEEVIKMEKEVIDLLKKLVEYEMECAYHQPHLWRDPDGEIDYRGCERCLLNGKPYCKLGLLRLELYRLFIAGKVPYVFKSLILGGNENETCE